MKKLNYLLLPLLAVPFIVGCNSKPKINHEVTEDEFNKALKFEGEEYLQMEMSMDTDVSHGSQNCKIAPGVFHKVEITAMSNFAVSESYLEIYSVGDTNSCKYITRDDKEGDFSEEQKITKDQAGEEYTNYFMVPQDVDLSTQLTAQGIAYKDFEFKDDAYYCHHKDPKSQANEGYDTVDFCLKFSDKKLTSLDMALYDEETKGESGTNMSVNLSYEKITPVDPSKK